MDVEWIAAIGAGVAVVVTYTRLVARYLALEEKVKDLVEWSESIDPKHQRKHRRDSDVIKTLKPPESKES